jgi:hypothetical protein
MVLVIFVAGIFTEVTASTAALIFSTVTSYDVVHD